MQEPRRASAPGMVEILMEGEVLMEGTEKVRNRDHEAAGPQARRSRRRDRVGHAGHHVAEPEGVRRFRCACGAWAYSGAEIVYNVPHCRSEHCRAMCRSISVSAAGPCHYSDADLVGVRRCLLDRGVFFSGTQRLGVRADQRSGQTSIGQNLLLKVVDVESCPLTCSGDLVSGLRRPGPDRPRYVRQHHQWRHRRDLDVRQEGVERGQGFGLGPSHLALATAPAGPGHP